MLLKKYIKHIPYCKVIDDNHIFAQFATRGKSKMSKKPFTNSKITI